MSEQGFRVQGSDGPYRVLAAWLEEVGTWQEHAGRTGHSINVPTGGRSPKDQPKNTVSSKYILI